MRDGKFSGLFRTYMDGKMAKLDYFNFEDQCSKKILDLKNVTRDFWPIGLLKNKSFSIKYLMNGMIETFSDPEKNQKIKFSKKGCILRKNCFIPDGLHPSIPKNLYTLDFLVSNNELSNSSA